MKNKQSVALSLLAIIMLVTALILPAGLDGPAEAASSMLKWSTIDTPGSYGDRADILLRSEVNKIVVGPRGQILLAIVTRGTVVPPLQLYSSGTRGRTWGGVSGLRDSMLKDWGVFVNVWDAAIAPDDQRFWAVATSSSTVDGPVEVWVTQDGGITWEDTGLELPGGDFISCLDISPLYAGKRDILVGTRDGTGLGTGKLWVRNSTPFGSWRDQTGAGSNWSNPGGDVVAAKFSPTYAGDGSIVVVYAAAPAATTPGTFLAYGVHDLDSNTTTWAQPIEIKSPASPGGASPDATTIVTADLELPSDFSGQAASLRRAYVSFYSDPKDAVNQNGIYRIDDTVVYVLMDTTDETQKDISSITYVGTYASGKLLAGERWGYPCTASVPTWFTDSPTVCPIPCWYPAVKPTTGAANQGTCSPGSKDGYGNAQVAWSPEGDLAFVGTGSACLGPFSTPNGSVNCNSPEWPDGYLNWVRWDESAFGISRNNGETWNQTGLIDTEIVKFTDVAVSPDCKTIYLASVNVNWFDQSGCDEFDSVWRSSSNREVESPFTAMPVGTYWERVLTRVTALDCTEKQTDLALLRLVPYCADPSGQIVAWAAWNTRAQAWSPDYGDYWATITPRDPIQDFCFESKTVMYNLSPNGLVQKLPYTGTAWATTLPSVDTTISSAHTIAAYPEGKVLVGAATDYHHIAYAVAYSSNFNTDNPSFTVQTTAGRTVHMGNVHVAFHPQFKDNNLYYIGDDLEGYGSVYRNNPNAQTRWTDTNMMDPMNGAVGCPPPDEPGIYGLWVSYTGEALYAAGWGPIGWDPVTGPCEQEEERCQRDWDEDTFGVWRTLDLLQGMPKPGIAWDFLWVGLQIADDWPRFTLEPSSLKACGCCTTATDTTLYAIDNVIFPRKYDPDKRAGMLWAYTDCLAKKGPRLVTPDKATIGCDPASGRAAEVNLCWEQLCLADAYDVEIAKDKDFDILVIDWTVESACAALSPVDVLKPCAYFPAGGLTATSGFNLSAYASGRTGGGGGAGGGGSMVASFDASGTLLAPSASSLALWGNLQCGHTYYWRVKARHGATGEWIRSPWSDVRSFSIKAGVPVRASTAGLQLLSPANGAIGVPPSKPSFSWAPFPDTKKYKFVLAKDAALTQIIKEAEVTATAYQYDGTLDYDSNYFWRVMALEPAPSDWSTTFSFRTQPRPPAAAPPAAKAGLLEQLALPLKAMLNWLATLNLKLIPAMPLQPWAWVLIIVCIVLFILWLLVMLAISKVTGKPQGRNRRKT